MKVVFIGGGSYLTLPVVRSALAHRKVFNGGEISLYDINVPRAEAMGRMIMRTPEFKRVDCAVTWGRPLEEALEGADAVSITMASGSPLAARLSSQASLKRGFLSSDQLSPTGAFLGLSAGPTILDFARKMETACPDAWLTIFANPVAVYSGMVNNHTKIKAVGVCGGYTNHMWDLSRLMGREEQCPDYDVEVAGINHLSFILRGSYKGRDLFEVLREHQEKGWKPLRVGEGHRHLQGHIHRALRKMFAMLDQFGTLIFSTEGDGMAHLYYEETYQRAMKHFAPRTKAQLKADVTRGYQHREKADRRFRALLAEDLDESFWQTQPKKRRALGRNDHHATVKILKALAGAGREKIAGSRLNNGAVDGFSDRTVLEYSQIVDRRGIRPYGKLTVPNAFHGLIAALAEHQTLLGDAIATEDPKTLHHALYAYPIKQNTRASRALYRDLLKIHADDIPAVFQKTREYLR